MEPSMINYFLQNEGIMQMYLNSIMFINFSINLEDDFNILCKYLRKNNLFNFEEKNNSRISNTFSNFVQIITSMPLKSISPKTINKLYKNFENSRVLTNKYKTRNLIKTVIKI